MEYLNNIIPKVVKVIEKFLAFVVLLSVILFILNSFKFFLHADWQTKEIFYELIYRALLVTIGLELARMLVTHNFLAILELLAFVVARKMLKPDLTSGDILLGSLSFVVLLLANHYLISPRDQSKNKV